MVRESFKWRSNGNFRRKSAASQFFLPRCVIKLELRKLKSLLTSLSTVLLSCFTPTLRKSQLKKKNAVQYSRKQKWPIRFIFFGFRWYSNCISIGTSSHVSVDFRSVANLNSKETKITSWAIYAFDDENTIANLTIIRDFPKSNLVTKFWAWKGFSDRLTSNI